MKTMNQDNNGRPSSTLQHLPSPSPSISGIIQKYFKFKNGEIKVFATDTLNVKCDVYLNGDDAVTTVTNYILSYSEPDDISEIKRLFPIPTSNSQNKLFYYGPVSSLSKSFVFYFYDSDQQEYRLAYFNLQPN